MSKGKRLRFVSGAICPKCKKIDKIALAKDDKKIFCVSCDFEEYKSEIKPKDQPVLFD